MVLSATTEGMLYIGRSISILERFTDSFGTHCPLTYVSVINDVLRASRKTTASRMVVFIYFHILEIYMYMICIHFER